MCTKTTFFLIAAILAFIQLGYSADKQPVTWKFKTNAAIHATPVVDATTIYIGSTDSIFYAVDLNSGTELWHYHTNYPINSKAIVCDSMVLFESGFRLIALNKITGEFIWSFVASNNPPIMSEGFTDYHHSSPVLYNGNLYFGDGWGNMNGVDVLTGKLKFQYHLSTDSSAIRSTPAIKEDKIYFGDWAGHVYAVSLIDSSLIWTYSLANRRAYYGMVTSDMIIHDTLLYFGSQHDVFSPLDLKSGKPAWTFIDPKQTYLPSTPVFYDNQVIIGSTVITFRIYSLTDGQVNWAFPTDGICFVYPVIIDSVLIMNTSNFGNAGTLYAINCNNGKLINDYHFSNASPASPVIAGQKLLLGNGDGNLFAFDVNNFVYPTEDTSLVMDTNRVDIILNQTDKRQAISSEIKNISFACDSFQITNVFDVNIDLTGISLPSETVTYIASGSKRNINIIIDPSKMVPGIYEFQLQMRSKRHPDQISVRNIKIEVTDNSSIHGALSKPEWNVFPNPASKMVCFENQNARFETVELTIFNLIGEQIYRYTEKRFNGQLFWNFAEETDKVIKPGVYIFKLQATNSVNTGVITVTR